MSRILLADDSPHAQRMGEFILREDGFEVVSVTDGRTAALRLADVDPDLILADVSLPQQNGYELCLHIKHHPNHRHARVVLTAGAMEPIDELEAARVRSDAILRKPFEASVMIELVKRLVVEAKQARLSPAVAEPTPESPVEPVAELPAEPPVETPPAETVVASTREAAEPPPETPLRPVIDPEAVWANVTRVLEGAAAAPAIAPDPLAEPEPVRAMVTPVLESPEPPPAAAPRPVIDPESIRATVTLALEAALPVLIDEITQRVTLALAEDAGEPAQ